MTISIAIWYNIACKNILENEVYKYVRDWMVSVFRTVILKSENKQTLIDTKEAEEVMQYIVDEPIEGYDIFATKREWERKSKTEVAFNLLKNNISDDIILECTGISAGTLERLKKKLTKK